MQFPLECRRGIEIYKRRVFALIAARVSGRCTSSILTSLRIALHDDVQSMLILYRPTVWLKIKLLNENVT